MTRQMFALSLGLGAMLAAAQIAHSAPHCDSRAAVTAKASGTCTIAITLPDGRTRLTASGTTYEAVS